LLAARALAQQGGDRLGDALAAIHLVRLGADEPELAATVESLGLPQLQAALLLATAARAVAPDAARHDTELAARCRQQALDLCSSADLPLPIHLRALAMAGLDASARSLAQSIAERFPDSRSRRRFLRTWENVRTD
jgi:hypothetical protein